MGWWTLGTEEENDQAQETRRSTSGGRGGRGAAGRGRGRGRGRGVPTRATDTELSDDGPSLFTSIGLMVSNTVGGLDDTSTVGTAKYPGQKPKTANADEAQRRANEMANAMAWLTQPAPDDDEPEPAPAPGDGLFTGGANWWEQDDVAPVDDGVSVFSGGTDFKTEAMPDLMSMLRAKQDENDKERERKEREERKAKKASKMQFSTKEAEARTKKMASAVDWWTNAYNADAADVQIDGAKEMRRVMDWWSAHQNYQPPSSDGFDKDKKNAMKVSRALEKYGRPELAAEQKAKELQDAVKWWQNKGDEHSEEMKDFEYDQSTFKRVNHLFGQWELKGTPIPEWEKFDPREDLDEAERRAQDLQGCLGLVTSGHFDERNPHYNSEAMNRLKDVFVDWKFKDDNRGKEAEDALKWWRMHASTYDPLTASAEDEAMFRRAKGLLALFGLKEGDPVDARNKEMTEALDLWARYKDSPVDELDPSTADKIKKVRHALIQLKRDEINPADLKLMAEEMNELMDWYRSRGYEIKDLTSASKADAEKFKKAQGLLKLWGYKIDPTPEQLKEIADSLIFFRRNGFKPEIFDQYDGDEGAKFRRLQQAMVDWRLKGAESDQFSADESEAISREISNALDWWRDNGDNFNAETASTEHMFTVEKIKEMVDSWKPRDAEQTFTWRRSKKPSKEISEAMDLWRENGMSFDFDRMDISPSQRQVLAKLKDAMLEWRRNNASNISEAEAEQTVKEMINAMNWWKKKGKDYDATGESLDAVSSMMRHKEASDALAEWHRDLGFPKHQFAHLSRKKAKEVAKELDDAMVWWQRNGKDVDVKKDLEDEEEFRKAQRLAQFWQKQNMSPKDRETAAGEISDLLDWTRKQSKDFDIDEVGDEEADKMRALFQCWSAKKDRKPKSVAKEIEDALKWWRRNNFSVDSEDETPADAEKMNKLDSLVQKWSDLSKDEAGSDDNLNWFRKQNLEEINESLQTYEGDKEPKKPEAPQFVGKLTDEQKRAKEMSSALDWLRSNDAELDINDEESVALSVQTFKKIEALMPKSSDESGPTTLGSALDWLRSKTEVDDETVSSFKKLDTVLAKAGSRGADQDSGFGGALDWLRKRQAQKTAGEEDDEDESTQGPSLSTKPRSEEQKRAEDMASALDWLRSNDAVEDIDDEMSSGIGSVASFKAIDSKPKSDDGTGMVSALDWLRSQEKKRPVQKDDEEDEEEEDIDPTAFASIRPKTAEEKRASEMADALGWLRDHGVEMDEDEVDLANFEPGTALDTFTDKDTEIDNALSWLRGKNPEDLSNIDDTDFQTLSGLSSVPKTKEQLKAQQMGNALDWIRKNGAEFDGDEVPDFSDYGDKFGTVDAFGRSAEQQSQEMARALDWLRNKDPNSLDDLDDPFSKFAGAAGSAVKTKEQEKADAMAKALGWLRNKGGDFSEEDEPDFDFEKFGLADGLSPKSQEERAKDMTDALNWLRNKDAGIEDEDEDTAKFNKLDMLLPKKGGQSAEARAKEMENAMSWLRSKGLDLDDDDLAIESFEKIGVVDANLRSAEKSEMDVEAALNWLRNKDDATLDPTGIFKQLDASLPTKSGQSKEDRAVEIANALKWMRNRGLEPDAEDEESYPSFKKLDSQPFFAGSAIDSAKEMEDALAWLRNKEAGVDDSDFDPNDIFKKIDASLPQKSGQSDNDRAKDIHNALNWMRKQGFDLSEDVEADPSLDKVGSVSVSRRSGDSEANDRENALNWLRNQGLVEDDTLFDPTGVFKKLDASLPTKTGQSPEDRAKDMENALAWMREKGLVTDDTDMAIPSFDKLDQVGVAQRSPEDRAKDTEDALNWLRNMSDGVDEETDPSGKFKKLDAMLPKKAGQSPEDRAREMENALNWMRNQGLEADFSDEEAVGFDKVDGVSTSRRTPEQRVKDMEDALNWLRNKGQDDENFDPKGVFRQLDSTLPKKANQTPNDRAKEIAKALDWMRNKGLHTDADDDESSFDKVGATDISRCTPEQKAKDLEKILNWMRKGKGKGKKKEDKYDPTGEFRKLDGLLPKKKSQTPEDRAREIEGALDWLRTQGTGLVEDEYIPSLGKVGTVDISRRTPEARAKDLEDALNWIRNKGNDDDSNDPTGDFRKLDSMLPKKRGQTPEERAREIEEALDWLRSKGPTAEMAEDTSSFDKVGSLPICRRSPEERSEGPRQCHELDSPQG